jgi:hypothetical protein
MDVLGHLEALGAKPWIIDQDAVIERTSEIEAALQVVLPSSYSRVLEKYGTSITFDNEVLFKPEELSGWEGKDGTLDLVGLYGLARDDRGLSTANAAYGSQIPSTCIVIGESSGGNQLCLDRQSLGILFWDHEAESEGRSTYLVSNSFEDFINRLQRGDNQVGSTEGIIADESFLDF